MGDHMAVLKRVIGWVKGWLRTVSVVIVCIVDTGSGLAGFVVGEGKGKGLGEV